MVSWSEPLKSNQKSARLQFIYFAFLIVLELVHVLLELLTLLFGGSLFVLRYLDGRSQISNRLFQLFYLSTKLDEMAVRGFWW